jgi:hypothetical protein
VSTKVIKMVSTKNSTSGLDPVQQLLLRLLRRPMTDEETLDLKRILVQYFGSQLRKELKKVSNQKGYADFDFEIMLNKES